METTHATRSLRDNFERSERKIARLVSRIMSVALKKLINERKENCKYMHVVKHTVHNVIFLLYKKLELLKFICAILHAICKTTSCTQAPGKVFRVVKIKGVTTVTNARAYFSAAKQKETSKSTVARHFITVGARIFSELRGASIPAGVVFHFRHHRSP